MNRSLLFLAVVLLMACSAWAASDADGYAGLTDQDIRESQQAFDKLRVDFGNIRACKSGPMVTRLYGLQFGYGNSPENSAEQFCVEHARVFGLETDNLVPGNLQKTRQLTQPLMYNQETGEYKFTLVYYRQEHEGIPVYQSELRLLTRNDVGFPIVLAVSTLRDLGDFTPDKGFDGYAIVAEEVARADESGLTDFTKGEVVIWAGADNKRERPRMAIAIEGSSDFPEQFRYVIDPVTGEILYKEDRIVFEDVVGNVSGMASQGNASDNCEPEALEAFPFAKVSIGSTVVYTDENGDFVIPNGGTSGVTVTSPCVGQWFNVINYTGSEEIINESVTPPGPANIVHNAANNSESVRSQTNAYIETNVVRSMAIAQNPSYPNLNATEFPVRVNRTDGYCPGNAWYDPGEQSINFCSSGGSYPNTAWNAIIHHEYGHHLINMGGSGQGQYGEGMADCIHVVIYDAPELALGFFGDCNTPLRNADNNHQYPCEGSIHDCGQLLSGCVWDTRNALVQTTSGPSEYLPIIRNLTVNSILLHTGTEITPQITIDWLTLDDTDGNINNGTPHYWEIAAGFGLHNMDAPELAPLLFTYPQGTPTLLAPGSPTSFTVIVSGIGEETPVSGTGMLYYSIEGGTTVSVAMTETSANNYIATLPPVQCLERVEYYVSAEAAGIGIIYDPNPAMPRLAFAATEEIEVFNDNFDSDLGWTVSGGSWGRGTPTGSGGQYGNPDPTSGHSGSNVYGYNLNGDYENSMPERHLTSPAIDCSELANTSLSFWRWLGVEQPIYDHAYVRISNDGSNWTTIWENTGTVSDAAWTEHVFDISSFADGESTVYVRFTMGTTDGAWQYCGWNIDDVVLNGYECNANSPNILTTYLPEWTEGHPYSETLLAEGGTTPYIWSNKNGDLTGSGLSLSSDGLISGTPTSAGWISFTAMVVDDSSYSDEEIFTVAINPVVEITTTSLPDWTAGSSYSRQLTAEGGTGTIRFTDLNGDLAGTGLSISSVGLVSGTPVEGPVSFTAVATDGIGATGSAGYSFTINPNLEIITTSLPDGDFEIPYSQTLTATGGTGTYTWIDLNGDLDGSGLSLGYNGVLSGTPSTVGMISFTARVTDLGGAMEIQAYSFEIIQALQITTEVVDNWTESHPLSVTLIAVGGQGGYTWTDKNGDLSGTGLALATDGILSGTATVNGNVTFIAVVEDSVGGLVEKQFSFDLAPAVVILTTSLPDGELDMIYSASISATGGTGGLLYSDKNGDLAGTGLTLIPLGILQGTPNSPGTITFTVVATDIIGATDEVILSFDINQSLTITTTTLPEWTVNSPYTFELQATGGSGSNVWSDKNGDLAGSGLTLATDGNLSGTPTSVGTITFIALVSDDRGEDEKELSITINPTMVFVTLTLPDWTEGVPYSTQIDVSGGTGTKTFSDQTGTLAGTGLSLSSGGLVSGTPLFSGPINFTAQVVDLASSTISNSYEFAINLPVSITSDVLPDGMAGIAYATQLTATDGTGNKTWIDKNGDLSGYGLSLASSGLLTGTVTTEQVVTFTAEVTDNVGSIDEKLLTLIIGPAWICGDANGDGSGPDIADLVYLVDYMFNSGTAPAHMAAVDFNGTGSGPDIADLVYLVDYMFGGGPDLACP